MWFNPVKLVKLSHEQVTFLIQLLDNVSKFRPTHALRWLSAYVMPVLVFGLFSLASKLFILSPASPSDEHFINSETNHFFTSEPAQHTIYGQNIHLIIEFTMQHLISD